jgi:hypothetical protein
MDSGRSDVQFIDLRELSFMPEPPSAPLSPGVSKRHPGEAGDRQ